MDMSQCHNYYGRGFDWNTQNCFNVCRICEGSIVVLHIYIHVHTHMILLCNPIIATIFGVHE